MKCPMAFGDECQQSREFPPPSTATVNKAATMRADRRQRQIPPLRPLPTVWRTGQGKRQRNLNIIYFQQIRRRLDEGILRFYSALTFVRWSELPHQPQNFQPYT